MISRPLSERKKIYREFVRSHAHWCDAEDLREIIIDMMSRTHDLSALKKSFEFSCQKKYSENENSANLGMQ